MLAVKNQLFLFNSDSVLKRPSSKGSISEKYYVKDSLLYIQDSNHPFSPTTILLFNDSSLKTIDLKDSVVFVFKKQ